MWPNSWRHWGTSLSNLSSKSVQVTNFTYLVHSVVELWIWRPFTLSPNDVMNWVKKVDFCKMNILEFDIQMCVQVTNFTHLVHSVVKLWIWCPFYRLPMTSWIESSTLFFWKMNISIEFVVQVTNFTYFVHSVVELWIWRPFTLSPNDVMNWVKNVDFCKMNILEFDIQMCVQVKNFIYLLHSFVELWIWCPFYPVPNDLMNWVKTFSFAK